MNDDYLDINLHHDVDLDPHQGPLDEPDDIPLFHSERDVSLFDDALLPAALCATSYSESCWAFDVAAGLADPRAWMGEEQFARDRDALARGLMITKACRPLGAEELGVDPAAHGARMERGMWRSGSLSQALCCVAPRDDGTKELHISVRGTDMSSSPSRMRSAFNALVGYFAWTYPRIDKHAKAFESLFDAARSYADDPANGISRIVVSGHSLGGAAAEALLPRLTSGKTPCQLFTFGSPGSGSGLVVTLATFLSNPIRRILSEAIDFAAQRTEKQLAAFSPAEARPVLAHFSLLARVLASQLAPAAKPLTNPQMQFHFRHPQDPVPKLGALWLYTVGSKPQHAMSALEFEAGPPSFFEPIKFSAHSCARYFSSVHSMLTRALADVAPFAEPTLGMRRFAAARREAVEMEASIDPSKVGEAVAQARAGAREKLRNQHTDDPSLGRLGALPEPSALASKIAKARLVRRVSAMLTGQMQGWRPG